MKIWDSKDVRIIAMAIDDVAPNDKASRADLILAAALEAGVTHKDLREAADRYWAYLQETVA